MKKLLLSISCLISVSVLGQTSVAETDLSAQGTTFTYYVLDSNANEMSGTTGSGATWDYSTTTGYSSMTKVAATTDATASAYSSDFPNAEDMVELPDFVNIFYSHDANTLNSQGYVFDEPSLGEVKVKLNTDDALLMNFPTTLASADINDVISGEIEVNSQTISISGTSVVTTDGEGTLMLSQNDYDDVLRIKIRDSVHGTVPFVGDVDVIRTTYEYRKPAESNYPLFQYTKIEVMGAFSTNPTVVVLSKEDGASASSGIEDTHQPDFTLYPNPAKNVVNIKFNNNTEVGQIDIINSIGQKAIQVAPENISNQMQIDISALPKGIYFVRIQVGNKITTQRISVL